MSRGRAADLVLPSAGPDPIPLDTAVAAVLGYARARRPLRFRSISFPDGSWAQVPAFGHERFDAHPATDLPLGEVDILTAEGLHGRLRPPEWHALRDTLQEVRPVADALLDRAAGRAFHDLPDEEFSVLAEPGTVGALLRELQEHAEPHYVLAALHHRHRDLVPLLSDTTWRQLGPHRQEGDSGVEAVIHRELRANADAFDQLEKATAELSLTRLRLHDVLVWLTGSLRLAHAVAAGRT
ncbi:hypothetical protein GCM10010531_08960 [Blastococcus jejuensis]|uniref:DUF403 domain-containing protein n=1 Tax=Blastococcus jejuensis TaxID=351224 RepID=A0ABP6P175_9ACTN